MAVTRITKHTINKTAIINKMEENMFIYVSPGSKCSTARFRFVALWLGTLPSVFVIGNISSDPNAISLTRKLQPSRNSPKG